MSSLSFTLGMGSYWPHLYLPTALLCSCFIFGQTFSAYSLHALVVGCLLVIWWIGYCSSNLWRTCMSDDESIWRYWSCNSSPWRGMYFCIYLYSYTGSALDDNTVKVLLLLTRIRWFSNYRVCQPFLSCFILALLCDNTGRLVYNILFVWGLWWFWLSLFNTFLVHSVSVLLLWCQCTERYFLIIWCTVCSYSLPIHAISGLCRKRRIWS